MDNKVFTENELARYLGISPKKLQADRQGKKGITYFKIGRSIRYLLKDVELYLNQNSISPYLHS